MSRPVGGTITESGPWRALDGSGWELLSDGTRMVDSAGVRCIGGTRTNRNGNQIVVSSRVITDTLGRQIPITMGIYWRYHGLPWIPANRQCLTCAAPRTGWGNREL